MDNKHLDDLWKENKTLRYKLFTHLSDMDGIMCGLLAEIAFDKQVDIEYVTYKNVNDIVRQFLNTNKCWYDKIFITDISINEELCNLIDDSNYKNLFVLLDHHDVKHIIGNKYPWAKEELINSVGVKQAGCSLFYKYLQENKYLWYTKQLGELVELVRSYDTWDWTFTKNQKAKDLCDIFFTIGKDDFIKVYKDIICLNEFTIPDNHLELLKYKRLEVDRYIKIKMGGVKIIKDIWGNTAAIVIADNCISELGLEINKKYKVDYVAIFAGYTCNLRSVGDFDVSEIAKKYGGGGRTNTAAFHIDITENVFGLILK